MWDAWEQESAITLSPVPGLKEAFSLCLMDLPNKKSACLPMAMVTVVWGFWRTPFYEIFVSKIYPWKRPWLLWGKVSFNNLMQGSCPPCEEKGQMIVKRRLISPLSFSICPLHLKNKKQAAGNTKSINPFILQRHTWVCIIYVHM